MTSDNKEEVFDVVDEEDEVIGQAKRGEVHTDNRKVHRSVGVVIFNSKGEIFLQKRSSTKDVDPNKWTISCSGHVSFGDSYEETVIRELKEELGLIINKGTPCSTARGPLDMKPVVKFIYRSETETETVMLFKAFSDGPFKLNKQEISQGKFFTRRELNNLIKSGEIEFSKEGLMALEKIGWA